MEWIPDPLIGDLRQVRDDETGKSKSTSFGLSGWCLRAGALDVLGHFAGLYTGSADFDTFRFAINQRSDRLKVWIPAPFSRIVGVRDIIPERGLFTAYFTRF